MEAIYPLVSGAMAQEKRLEVITNNLANVNTGGFKKDMPIFEGTTPSGMGRTLQTGSLTGVPSMFGMMSQIVTDFSAGSIRTTGEPLDVAIEGEGFFAVQTPQGTRYTRNGRFTLNAEGEIVTQSGFPVLGTGGPITLPPGIVRIDLEGRISVRGTEAGGSPVEVDLLPIFQFSDLTRLRKTGETVFEAVGGGAVPSTEGRLHQGSLEESNVNPVEEMVSMITAMRLYESAQKAIQTADEAAAKAANEVGRVG